MLSEIDPNVVSAVNSAQAQAMTGGVLNQTLFASLLSDQLNPSASGSTGGNASLPNQLGQVGGKSGASAQDKLANDTGNLFLSQLAQQQAYGQGADPAQANSSANRLLGALNYQAATAMMHHDIGALTATESLIAKQMSDMGMAGTLAAQVPSGDWTQSDQGGSPSQSSVYSLNTPTTTTPKAATTSTATAASTTSGSAGSTTTSASSTSGGTKASNASTASSAAAQAAASNAALSSSTQAGASNASLSSSAQASTASAGSDAASGQAAASSDTSTQASSASSTGSNAGASTTSASAATGSGGTAAST